MTVSPYTYCLHNCLVVHLKPHSPLSPLKNYHSSSTNLSMTNFPPFPSTLKNLILPHLIKLSPFSILLPQPLPLPILKQIINTVSTPLHQIICCSLSSGSVPPDFKKAVITPILKNPNLDNLSPSNYRSTL